MTLTTSIENSIAIVVIDNPPVNALSQQLRQELLGTIEQLEADDTVHAIVLMCAGRTFIAGADLNEFGKSPEPPHLPDVIAQIERSRKPWVAAIHGNALGGGLEVSLGCSYRVASPETNFGLAEVKLGIVPGAGGTVRLPRLIELQAAIDIVTAGAPIGTDRAKALGLIDAIIDGDLRKGATSFATSVASLSLPKPISARPLGDPGSDFWERAQVMVAAKAKREVAPLRALASIRNACEADVDSAMAFERTTFLELRNSEQAAALRHVFFAERAAPRPPEIAGLSPREIRTAAVVGGGTMGAGIVASLRDAGLPVILIERDHAAVHRGLQNIRSIYDGVVKKSRMTTEAAVERMSGISGSADPAALSGIDLVIEAVFEDLDVKRAVFAKLSEHCTPQALLATNTSYLDPDEIGAGLANPERFLGLHFFSPAHVMKLLEIVPASQTSSITLATGFALARLLGKIPVRAGICDGFIGNRILKVSRAQAERVLLSGASVADVDRAMRSFGMPMGPFEAQDLGGLDIAAFQRKAARARGDTVFAPVADRLCELERFGQKTGGGWYDYTQGERKPVKSDVVSKIIKDRSSETQQVNWDEKSIAEAIIFPMISEGAAILQERVALRSADIDLVEIHGYGFPRWRGGLMHYGQSIGLTAVLDRLNSLAAEGLAPVPSEGLYAAGMRTNWEIV